MALKTENRTISKIYGILPGTATYGAVVPSKSVVLYEQNRTRAWHTLYRNKFEAAKDYLARGGYNPTLPYSDKHSDLVNSEVVTVTGLLNSNPASTFTVSFVPGTARPATSILDADFPALVSAVQASLQSKISGNGFNAYVSAAEARKTGGMIGDAATRMVQAYTGVRRGDYRAAASMLGLIKVPRRVSKNRTIEDNWLEYRYGWRLVVQDVANLLKTLHDSLNTRPPVLRVYAKAEKVRSSSSTNPNVELWIPGAGPAAAYSERRDYKTSLVVRGGYTYALSSVPLATGQSFGMTNPFTVAWELIPYSFVADWFVNVGSVLEGLTAFQGKSYLDGFLCKEIEGSTKYTWYDFRKVAGIASLVSPGAIASKPVVERTFNREQMTFTPSSLRLEVDLNFSRALDAIALIGQQARRMR